MSAPAPPPLPPMVIQSETKVHAETKQLQKGTDQVRHLCDRLINRQNNQETDDSLWVAFHQPVKPVSQDGPMCGLVALCMASQLIGSETLDTDSVLADAQNRGFTKQGEMFSAHQMGELAQSCMKCRVQVTAADKQHMLEALCQGHVLLVPYDADGNHEPCCKKGHKAHWAIVTGLVLTVDASLKNSLLSHCQQDKANSHLFHIKKGSFSNVMPLLDLSGLQNTYVLAQQGKSRYLGLWSLDQLIASNKNLEEIGPKIQENIDDFVLPKGGMQVGLQNLIVILTKCSST